MFWLAVVWRVARGESCQFFTFNECEKRRKNEEKMGHTVTRRLTLNLFKWFCRCAYLILSLLVFIKCSCFIMSLSMDKHVTYSIYFEASRSSIMRAVIEILIEIRSFLNSMFITTPNAQIWKRFTQSQLCCQRWLSPNSLSLPVSQLKHVTHTFIRVFVNTMPYAITYKHFQGLFFLTLILVCRCCGKSFEWGSSLHCMTSHSKQNSWNIIISTMTIDCYIVQRHWTFNILRYIQYSSKRNADTNDSHLRIVKKQSRHIFPLPTSMAWKTTGVSLNIT